MERVGIKEFKNRATQIVRDVREHSARYVVTVDGTPAAILKPYDAAEDDGPEPGRDDMTDEEIDEWFRGLDELAARIGKAWPKGLSAADAVAEQRRQL